MVEERKQEMELRQRTSRHQLKVSDKIGGRNEGPEARGKDMGSEAPGL